jgi:hypothetical protein
MISKANILQANERRFSPKVDLRLVSASPSISFSRLGGIADKSGPLSIPPRIYRLNFRVWRRLWLLQDQISFSTNMRKRLSTVNNIYA